MSKHARRLAGLFAQLDAIYAELPTIQCKGECYVSCGPLPLTDLEARRLHVVTHVKPRTTSELTCIYLTPKNRCGAYAARPLICRAFGLVKAMSCMRGCLPDRWLNDLEFLRLAQAVERIGGGRVIRTDPNGLVFAAGETYAGLVPRREEAAVEADADRTRTLRALHGGRILAVNTDPI